MENEKNQSATRHKTKWILDLAIFFGFLLAMEPRSTGITIHEWFTLSALAAVLVHLLLNWKWIAQVTRRFFANSSSRARINYVLNWSLFIDGILLMLSGILISQNVVPALGLNLPEGFIWRGLHDMSANLALVILGFHTALHWDWIVDAFNKYIARPIAKLYIRRESQKDGAA